VEDFLICEEMWHIVANGESVSELNCLPYDLEQLAAGHLLSLGLLRQASEIEEITIDEEAKTIIMKLNPSVLAARLPDEDDFTLSASDIHRLQREFNGRCELFRQTGAAHSAALADKGGLLVFFDDVARHNALDKVIGEMILHGLSPSNKALIVSSRLASDMLRKVCATGVKLLIAPGAPTSGGVDLAEKNGITLLGFVREGNINVYSHVKRIGIG
jgi:FdhD protein